MAWFEDFMGLPGPAHRSRLCAYETLMSWPLPATAEVPSKEALIAATRGGLSQSTLYKHFGPTSKQPRLVPDLSMVEQVALEAKEVSVRPFLQGWRDEVSSGRLGPRLRLEALVSVVTRWALTYPALATMRDEADPLPASPGQAGARLSRLPVLVRRAAMDCQLATPGNAATHLVDDALTVVHDSVAFLLDDSSRIPLNALAHARPAILALRIPDGSLDARVRGVIRALSELMFQWNQAPETLDPSLVHLLEKAVRQLSRRAPQAVQLIPSQPDGPPFGDTSIEVPLEVVAEGDVDE